MSLAFLCSLSPSLSRARVRARARSVSLFKTLLPAIILFLVFVLFEQRLQVHACALARALLFFLSLALSLLLSALIRFLVFFLLQQRPPGYCLLGRLRSHRDISLQF